MEPQGRSEVSTAPVVDVQAERRGRTPYRRFLAEAEPNLPAPLRNGTVQWLTVIAFHWALIVFAWSVLSDATRPSTVADP